jgi:hypothetical protein
MRIRTKLTPVGQQVIDDVGEETAVCVRTVTVVETANIPRDVRALTPPILREHEPGNGCFDFVAPHLLRRAEHRRRNEGQDGMLSRRDFQILTIDEDQIGIGQRRKIRAIVDTPVPLSGSAACDRAHGKRWRRGPSDEQAATLLDETAQS